MDGVGLDEGDRLSTALRAVPEGSAYGPWWGSAEGRWLHQAISDRIGAPATKNVHRLYGQSYEAGDVANTAIVVLAKGAVRTAIADAKDPWAYLYSTLKRELNGQAGPHFRSDLDLDAHPQIEFENAAAPSVTVNEAIRLTAECLTDLAPSAIAEGVAEAVYYFAERGHSQLSHLYTRSTKDPELIKLGLTRRNILAIANAVLGSRPHHGEASLLAGFLSSDEWTPQQSIPHRRALVKYEARMHEPVENADERELEMAA
jgi:hypothetical protein